MLGELADLAGRLAHLRLDGEPLSEYDRSAAVAIILRRELLGPEVLLMRRVEHPEDRWSGQVSLPGGHADPHEQDLLLTTVREAREEVGVDLERSARLLGRLHRVRARARGGFVPLLITPFVFACTEPVAPAAGAEADEIFWFPLERAASGELSSVLRVDGRGAATERPCWRYENRVVWGLTHHMLSELLELGFGAPRSPS